MPASEASTPNPCTPGRTGKFPVPRVVDSYDGVPCDWIRPDSAPIRPGEPCGEIHDRCRGHKKSTNPDRIATRGDPCGSAALTGMLVCRLHGGNAPQVKAAAVARVEKQRALEKVGPLIAEALAEVSAMSGADQLLRAIRQAGAMATTYRWLLDELPTEAEWNWEEVRGEQGGTKRWVVMTGTGLLGPDAQGVAQLHAYEEGFRYWTNLHGKLLVEAAKIGLDERRQVFAETQVQAISTTIRTIVSGLGRQLDDPEVVPVVEAALRALTGETA